MNKWFYFFVVDVNLACYTKYDIACHMALYDTTITFLVTISIKKFANIVIMTYFQSVQMPITETKFDIICILIDLWWNIVMDDWDLDERSLRKRQSLQHYDTTTPSSFNKEWQILLGWHLEWVTLPRSSQRVSSKTNRIGDTKISYLV